MTGITLTFTGPYTRSGGSCGAAPFSLNAGANCTVGVVFQPTAVGSAPGSLAVAGGVGTVTGSPVTLTETGIAAVITASLTPASWTVSQARNCPGSTFAQRLACAGDPTQTFTLTNTGTTTLTGVSTGSLGGANTADYSIVTLTSSCGTNTFLGNFTTLTPGQTCTVVVRFQPLTSEAAGAKPATVRVTAGAAGLVTSVLNGTAN